MRRRAWVQIAAATLSGNSLRQTVHCLCSPSGETGSSPLKCCEDNFGPGGNYSQPTAGFVTHVTCRLTAKNRDQLRNPPLGNRVWATFTFIRCLQPGCSCLFGALKCGCSLVRSNDSREQGGYIFYAKLAPA